jgi:hypothetical protein
MELFAAALQHPEQVDVDVLQAEREQQEASVGDGGVSAQLGVPTWQVVLIVIAVIVGLMTFGALIQILHGN